MKLFANEENMLYHVCKIPPCLEGQPVSKLTKVFRVYGLYSETCLVSEFMYKYGVLTKNSNSWNT